MSREQLASAGEEIELAASAAETDDASERLSSLADQLQNLTERDHAPDHGRLARILNALGETRAAAGPEAAEHIDAAEDHIAAFRETIGGV